MKLLLLIFFGTISYCGFSQNPYILKWQKAYGGSSTDVMSSIKPTKDGGYIVGGYTMSSDGDVKSGNHGSSDFWILKINSLGNILWEYAYGDIGSESLNTIQQTTDDGFLLGGITNMKNVNEVNEAAGINNFLIIKINSDGIVQWKKTYGGTGDDELYSIQSTTDGGFLVGGWTNSIDGDVKSRNTLTYDFWNFDFWVIKIDNFGNILWEKSYGKSNSNDKLNVIQPTLDGGYILGGLTAMDKNGVVSQGVNGPSNFWIVKIDLTGNILWDQIYGGSGDEELWSILQSPDRGFLLAGDANSVDGDVQSRKDRVPSPWDRDFWVVKIDETGNFQWEQSYGGNDWERLFSACAASDSSYLLVGASPSSPTDDKLIYSENHGGFDYWIINIDSLGNIKWEQRYGGSKDEGCTSVLQTKDEGYLLGGYSQSNDGDFHSVAHGLNDYWVVKIAKNATAISEQVKINSGQVKIFPNPVTRDNLTIQTSFNSPVLLKIYNIVGNLLIKMELTESNSQIYVGGLAKGMYLFQFINNEKILYQQKVVKK